MSKGRVGLIAVTAGVVGLSLGIIIGLTIARAVPTTATVVVEQPGDTPKPRRTGPDDDEPPPREAERSEPARTAVAAPRTTRAAPSRTRTAPPQLTAEQVRRIVAEEAARHDAGEGGPPPIPEPADPELNANPERRLAVRESVALLRRSVLLHDLSYSMGRGKGLARSDPARLEQFPDDRVWPDNPLGWVEKDAERYEVLPPDGDGFDPTRENAAYVFTGPVERPIATAGSATLVLDQGLAASGVLTMQAYSTIHCRGDLAGKVYLESYSTVVVEGDMTGEIISSSYATILVHGRLSGKFESRSYANLRVLGGFDGTLKLYDSNNVYFGGYVPESALERITWMDRGTLTFESTDSAPGKRRIKPRVDVIVLQPR